MHLRHIDLDYTDIPLESVVEAVEDIRKKIFGPSYERVSFGDLVCNETNLELITHYALTQGMVLDMVDFDRQDPCLSLASVGYNIWMKRHFKNWEAVKKIAYEFIEDTWTYTDGWCELEDKYSGEYCFYCEKERALGMTFEEALPIVKEVAKRLGLTYVS